MKFVEPIRNKSDILKIKKILYENSDRNGFLFTLGINVGFRIGDLLSLKVKDVKGKDYIDIKEEKTKKSQRFPINKSLKREIEEYVKGKPEDEYLFISREGENKPITTTQAYIIINGAAKKIGLENIGTHSLRKTFGYHHYKVNKDVAMLQEIFNHHSPQITLRYIGINQDLIDESLDTFYL